MFARSDVCAQVEAAAVSPQHWCMAVVMYCQYYTVRTQDLSKDGKGIEVNLAFTMFFATYYLQILPIVSSDLACC